MTDSTMVERVAEALIVVLGGLSQGTSASTLEKIDQLGGEIYDVWIEPEGIRTLARAAIEAMMEPTEAMLAAGQPLVGHVGSSSLDAGDDWVGDAKNVWQAMIRASLSKGEE